MDEVPESGGATKFDTRSESIEGHEVIRGNRPKPSVTYSRKRLYVGRQAGQQNWYDRLSPGKSRRRRIRKDSVKSCDHTTSADFFAHRPPFCKDFFADPPQGAWTALLARLESEPPQVAS